MEESNENLESVNSQEPEITTTYYFSRPRDTERNLKGANKKLYAHKEKAPRRK